MTQQKKKVVSIALLVADTPVPSVLASKGDYAKIYTRFLQDSLNSIKRHAWQPQVELHVRSYDVVKKMEYPDPGQLSDGLWDAVMITGSASSAYLDLEWTSKLAGFLRMVADEHPLVRLIGICYGHQILARAFDGLVESNAKGWEIGTTMCDLTEYGKELLGYGQDGDGTHPDKMAIQQMHKDHVVDVPPDFSGESFINLASTTVSQIQALVLKYPTESPPLPSTAQTSAYMAFDVEDSETASSGPHPLRSLHLLSVQGHPEFDREIVESIVHVRTEMGIVTGQIRDTALANAQLPHDGIKLGRAILAMLGVEEARTDTGDGMINVQSS